jgi:hypothetical protein
MTRDDTEGPIMTCDTPSPHDPTRGAAMARAPAAAPLWPRHPDWQPRLTDYLRANHARPFAWGRWDCALFVAGAVKAMTGRDPMRGYRGYRTLREGLRKARARGVEDHVAGVAASFAEIPPAFAGPGDIAAVPGEPGLALGIVQGAQVYVVGARGLGLVSLTEARRAFRV